MNVPPRRPLFNRKPQSNIYRMFLWVVMLLGGIWMLQQINSGEIQPLFQATPLPTRSVNSYVMEGNAYFSAGNVNKAITAYQEMLYAQTRMMRRSGRNWPASRPIHPPS